MTAMMTRVEDILGTDPVGSDDGEAIGRSRAGRTIRAFVVGEGPRRISLLAGCHADEPVGPRLLRHLAAYLGALNPDAELIRRYRWWIIPHLNPDGELCNRAWYSDGDAGYDLGRYLAQVVREAPGDDIEFGFPRDADDTQARPENLAASAWWHSAGAPFALHVTLHGMGFAAGPWYLVEPSWRDRIGSLEAVCRGQVAELGYRLHDVERNGEKGFVRLSRGFCTRPDSGAMRRYFLDRDDPDTAALFRPSSMETMRSLGGDPLTLVSEMPLFILPGVGEDLGPPDPVAVRWRHRIEEWRAAARGGGEAARAEVAAAAAGSGLTAMPVADQMALQWGLIVGGLSAVAER